MFKWDWPQSGPIIGLVLKLNTTGTALNWAITGMDQKKRVMDGTDLKLGHYLDWYLSGTGLNNRISLTVEHHWDGLNLGLGHWPQCLTCSSQVTAYTHMSCVRFEAIMAVHMTMAVV